MDAKPVNRELLPGWWKLYDDPMFSHLIEQNLEANPDLQAAAKRFGQTRDVMSQAQSQNLLRVGMQLAASHTRQSLNKLLRPPDEEYDTSHRPCRLWTIGFFQ